MTLFKTGGVSISSLFIRGGGEEDDKSLLANLLTGVIKEIEI